MTTTPKNGFSNSRLWTFVKISLALFLFAYVLSKTEYGELLALKDRFSWGWFGITFLLFFAMLLVKALQYYIFIGRKLSFLRTLEVVVVQNVLMSFVATAAGIASYLTMLGLEEDVRLGKAAESFILVKIGDIIAVLGFLFLSVIFVQPIPSELNLLFWSVVLFAALFFLALFLFFFLRRPFTAGIKKLITFLKLSHLKIIQKMLGYLDEIAKFESKKIIGTISLATLVSLLYIGLSMLWGYSRFQVFSFSIDLLLFIFIYSFLQLASWVPIYILGGLGVSEGIFVYLLGSFGIGGAELAAVLVGIRVVIYILNALPILYLPLKSVLVRNKA